MNIDPQTVAGYAMVAVGGFAIGALAGRWMMTRCGPRSAPCRRASPRSKNP